MKLRRTARRWRATAAAEAGVGSRKALNPDQIQRFAFKYTANCAVIESGMSANGPLFPLPLICRA